MVKWKSPRSQSHVMPLGTRLPPKSYDGCPAQVGNNVCKTRYCGLAERACTAHTPLASRTSPRQPVQLQRTLGRAQTGACLSVCTLQLQSCRDLGQLRRLKDQQPLRTSSADSAPNSSRPQLSTPPAAHEFRFTTVLTRLEIDEPPLCASGMSHRSAQARRSGVRS